MDELIFAMLIMIFLQNSRTFNKLYMVYQGVWNTQKWMIFLGAVLGIMVWLIKNS